MVHGCAGGCLVVGVVGVDWNGLDGVPSVQHHCLVDSLPLVWSRGWGSGGSTMYETTQQTSRPEKSMHVMKHGSSLGVPKGAGEDGDGVWSREGADV